MVSAPGGKKPRAMSFSVRPPTPPSFSMMSRTFQTGVTGANRIRSRFGILLLQQLHGLEVGFLEEGSDGFLAEGFGQGGAVECLADAGDDLGEVAVAFEV